MISILRLFNMLPKLRRPHVVVMVVLILSSLLVCPMMVQTTLAHDSISNHTTRIETTIPHVRLSIHVTSATAEGLALCSIADKIPQLTTYPTFSPTQSWVKTPTCDSYTSTNWCGWKGVTCTSGSVTSIDLSTGFGNLVFEWFWQNCIVTTYSSDKCSLLQHGWQQFYWKYSDNHWCHDFVDVSGLVSTSIEPILRNYTHPIRCSN